LRQYQEVRSLIILWHIIEMLENKVAIVTGASSGIGYSTSLALSKAGVRVAGGARRIDRLQELEAQIIKNKNNKGEQILFENLMLQTNQIVIHLLMP
jgi:NADP-dependent 3-hydroxy acid dehydrogenase YdfG